MEQAGKVGTHRALQLPHPMWQAIQGRWLELEQGPTMRTSGMPGPVVGGLPALFYARKNTAPQRLAAMQGAAFAALADAAQQKPGMSRVRV